MGDPALAAAGANARNQSSIDALARANDPYVKQIAFLNNQLTEIQDNSKLTDLATGQNPEVIIPYAQAKLKGLSQNDPEYAKWKGLLDAANQKSDELGWADKIKAGTATLEQFQSHVQDRLNAAAPGSTAARNYASNLATISQQITARDENKNDVAAFTKYVTDPSVQSATGYRDYLSMKLARTTDPAIQTTIAKQITDISSRITVQQQSERAQKALSIEADSRSGKLSTADAVQKLQDIAHDPNITASEVAHLQTMVDGMYTRATASASRAAASGAQSKTGELNDARTALEKAQASIKDTLSAGGTVSDQQLQAVDIASGLVQQMSEAIASDPNTSAGASRTARTEALTASQAGTVIRDAVDKAMLGGLDISPQGIAAFNASVAALPTAAQRAEALVNHATDLKYAIPRMRNFNTQQAVSAQADQANSASQKAIQLLMKPVPYNADETGTLHEMFGKYTAAGGTKGFSTWLGILEGSTDKNSAGAQLGGPISQATWDQLQGLTSRTAHYDSMTNSVVGNADAATNVTQGMDLFDQLTRGQFGQDASLNKSELQSGANGEATPQQLWYNSQVNAIPTNELRAAPGEQFPTAPAGLSLDSSSGGGLGDKPQADLQDPYAGMAPPTNEFQSYEGSQQTPPQESSAPAGSGGIASDQRHQLFDSSDPFASAESFLNSPTPITFDNTPTPMDLPPAPSFAPDMSAFAPDMSNYGTPGSNSITQNDNGMWQPPSDPQAAVDPQQGYGGYAGDMTGITHGY